jgi:hypothetical protein
MQSVAILLTMLMAPSPAVAGPGTGEQVAMAFRDLCLKTRADPGLARAEIRKLGWPAAVVQRPVPGKGYWITAWQFPFGSLTVGYTTIGGIELKTTSCSLVLKAANAPARAELEAALEAVLAPTRFRDSRKPLGDFTRVARIKDRDDEQELVTFVGNRVAMHGPGTIELRPGFAIDYSYTKGAHAKELQGR